LRSHPHKNPLTIGGSIQGKRINVRTIALPGKTSVSKRAKPRDISNSSGSVKDTTRSDLAVTIQNSEFSINLE
jgi:hypothetical protein